MLYLPNLKKKKFDNNWRALFPMYSGSRTTNYCKNENMYILYYIGKTKIIDFP